MASINLCMINLLRFVVYTLCTLTKDKNNISQYSPFVETYYTSNYKFSGKEFCKNFNCNTSPFKSITRIKEQKVLETEEGTYLMNKCGRNILFFSKSEITTSKLAKFCCNIGLDPAVITESKELMCLAGHYSKYLNTNYKFPRHYFALGFTDYMLNRDFRSCPDNIKPNEKLWAPGEPDNKNGTETVIVVDMKKAYQIIGFEDYDFLQKSFALCQYKTIQPTTPLPDKDFLKTSTISETMTSSQNAFYLHYDTNPTKVPLDFSTDIIPTIYNRPCPSITPTSCEVYNFCRLESGYVMLRESESEIQKKNYRTCQFNNKLLELGVNRSIKLQRIQQQLTSIINHLKSKKGTRKT